MANPWDPAQYERFLARYRALLLPRKKKAGARRRPPEFPDGFDVNAMGELGGIRCASEVRDRCASCASGSVKT